MAITIDQVEKYLGQNIKDEYGRVVGKLLTAYTDVSGRVESIEIALSEYQLENVEVSRLELTHDGIIVVASWKVWAQNVENKLDRVRRRMRAVDELYNKGSIPGYAYDEIKKKLSIELNSVREEAKKVKELLRKKLGQLEDQVIRLEKDMANLMVLYMSNEVSESAYKSAIDQLRMLKARSSDEKRDVERHLEIITKLESESQPKVFRELKTAIEPKAEVKPSESAPIQVQIVET
ncbi:MAG: hypothetical protein DRO09_01205 [Thermoprotei archaeon]|nr:MAG: hypothetical protein DRO09_01205 [Thermoprotei archaeon]